MKTVESVEALKTTYLKDSEMRGLISGGKWWCKYHTGNTLYLYRSTYLLGYLNFPCQETLHSYPYAFLHQVVLT